MLFMSTAHINPLQPVENLARWKHRLLYCLGEMDRALEQLHDDASASYSPFECAEQTSDFGCFWQRIAALQNRVDQAVCIDEELEEKLTHLDDEIDRQRRLLHSVNHSD